MGESVADPRDPSNWMMITIENQFVDVIEDRSEDFFGVMFHSKNEFDRSELNERPVAVGAKAENHSGFRVVTHCTASWPRWLSSTQDPGSSLFTYGPRNRRR